MQARDIVIGILSVLLIALLIYTFILGPESGESPDLAQIAASQEKSEQQIKEIAELKQSKEKLELQINETIKIKNEAIAQLQQQVDQQNKLLEEKANPESIVSLQKQITLLQEELEQKREIQNALTNSDSNPLEKASSPLQNQDMEISERSDKSVVIRFSNRVLFDTGKAQLKSSGKELLNKVGAVFNRIRGLDIQVEGHTDSRPIGIVLQKRYSTNWELSTARSTNVVRYLVENLGVDATHISAAGYGQFRPVANNDNAENRQLNRRVEFVLRPILPEKQEEIPDFN
ncbi:MAG: OmpA family protein [SAR324 cluster bacterium]|nr:OmpA family protein [SAR324 cluster bacterium]